MDDALRVPQHLSACFGDEFTVIDGAWLASHVQHGAALAALLNRLGELSAIAQGLFDAKHKPSPVTTCAQLAHSQHRVYVSLLHDDTGERCLAGLLKVGEKQLFHWDARGVMHQLSDMPSVLDFYVQERWQRQGVGRRLFEQVMQREQTGPSQLAYDRPSPKLLAFLRKHFGLAHFVPQHNKFVIFDDFFSDRAPPLKSVYDSIASRPLTARGR